MATYNSVFRRDLFSGKTAIVTGGGSGIGRCIAHELSSLGCHVIITGRTEEKLDRVASEIIEDGGTVSTASFDIRDEEKVTEVIAQLLEDHPRIDYLVNNAGGQFPAPAEAISQKGWEAVVRTNLTGGFLVARELFTQHMGEHGGAVVNMLADMWKGMPGMSHSGAARAGMLNLTKTLAVEWAHRGVRVNAIAPGWVASSGLDTYDEATRAMLPTLRNAVPLKRLATEAEISAGVVFLLSPAAAFITGECLKVDGGAPLAGHLWPTPDHDTSAPFNGFHRAVVPEALSE